MFTKYHLKKHSSVALHDDTSSENVASSKETQLCCLCMMTLHDDTSSENLPSFHRIQIVLEKLRRASILRNKRMSKNVTR